MALTQVDYTIFFRRLSDLPTQLAPLKESFYRPGSEPLDARWSQWLHRWRQRVEEGGDPCSIAAAMQRVNPAITWREWLVAPAYGRAADGDSSLVDELQMLFRHPYDAPTPELAAIDDRLKPRECFNLGGVSHDSCSS